MQKKYLPLVVIVGLVIAHLFSTSLLQKNSEISPSTQNAAVEEDFTLSSLYEYDHERYADYSSNTFLMHYPKDWYIWEKDESTNDFVIWTISTVTESFYKENKYDIFVPPEGEVIFSIKESKFENAVYGHEYKMSELEQALFSMTTGEKREDDFTTIDKTADFGLGEGMGGVRTETTYHMNDGRIDNLVVQTLYIRSKKFPEAIAYQVTAITDKAGYQKYGDDIEVMFESFGIF